MSIMSHYSVTEEQDDVEETGTYKKVTFGLA